MQGGIYTRWQYFRNSRTSGQVAILITLTIAVIFLFVAITINISKVAQKKTMTANAADGAVMLLSSYLSSLGNYLSQQYCEGSDATEWQKSMGGFFAILGTIIAIAAAVFSGGSSLLLWGGILGALAGAGNYYYQTVVLPDKITEAYNKEFAKMKPKDSFMEQAVFYALMLSVDDPISVIDAHDVDMDDDINEEISRFSEWYYSRLQALSGEGGGEFTRVRQEEVMQQFVVAVEEFAVRSNEFRSGFSEDATRPLIEGALLAGIDGAFILLLEELEDVFSQEMQPFPITFWIRDALNEESYDEVDTLSQDLFSFFLFALDITERVEGIKEGFCYQDVPTLIDTMDIWINYFYPVGNSGADAEDFVWHTEWQEQIVRMTNWQAQLLAADVQLDTMIAQKMVEMAAAEQSQDMVTVMQLSSEIAYLYELKERIVKAIQDIVDCQERLANFNLLIENMYVFWLQGGEENFAQRRQAVYSWQDSLGWHHVRVQVSDFALPFLRHEEEDRWYGHKERLHLENAVGTVWVEVTRYDQGTATSFAQRGVPLWNFRYTQNEQAETASNPAIPEQALPLGIRSKATAQYSYRNMPRIVGVDK